MLRDWNQNEFKSGTVPGILLCLQINCYSCISNVILAYPLLQLLCLHIILMLAKNDVNQRRWNFEATLCVRWCFKVSFVDDCQLGNLTRLTGNRGYMAVSPKPKQRAPERVAFCAWVISVDAGQKVNITWHHVTSGAVSLGDLTTGIAEEAGPLGQAEGSKGGVFMWPHRCFFSLRFVENGGEEYVHQRCRPHPGEGAIYLSKTNQVQVQVRTNPKEFKGATDNDSIVTWRPYVLFYQGKLNLFIGYKFVKGWILKGQRELLHQCF